MASKTCRLIADVRNRFKVAFWFDRLEPRPYAQLHSFWRDQFVLLQIINHNLDHIINDLIF
jgi:hypothetical protein